MMAMPCDGIIVASCLSCQDPFTLPSHLIIKDPKEYAEALKRSYESRQHFDGGHNSEPLMLRALFVQWLVDLRQGILDRSKGRRGGYRGSSNPRPGFLRVS